MNRRGFLGAILAACTAPAIVRAGILMPSRGIVIPTTAEVLAVSGNTLLTSAVIARECLRVLQENLRLEGCLPGWRLPKNPGDTIVIRKPQRFTGALNG